MGAEFQAFIHRKISIYLKDLKGVVSADLLRILLKKAYLYSCTPYFYRVIDCVSMSFCNFALLKTTQNG